MLPSLKEIVSGLNFAISLLRGQSFDVIKSKVIISPLGLWYVLVTTTFISILAKLTILKLAIVHNLPIRFVISTFPLMIIELCLFTMFVLYLLRFINKETYFYNFIISFLWLVSLQSSLVLLISILLWLFPALAIFVALVGAVISIQILVTQFRLARQLLDVSGLIAAVIVLGNILIGIVVGLLDQVAYGLVAG